MFTVRKEITGAILFNHDTLAYYYIDESMFEALIEILKGNRKSEYALSFMEHKVLQYDYSLNGRIVYGKRAQENMLIAPLSVFFQITEMCNLSCKHCFTRNSFNEGPELRYDEIISFIDRLYLLGVGEIVIGGGEPFIRTDILDILKYAGKVGVIPSITTNGLLLSDHIIDELSRLRLGYIKISIDGAKNEHEYIRGSGTYSQAMTSLRKLIERGVAVGVRMVINAMNYVSISCLYDELLQLGCKSLSFSMIRPSGNVRQNDELYRGMSRSIVSKTMQVIRKIKKEGKMKISLSEDFPYVHGLNSDVNRVNEILKGFGCPIKGQVCEVDAYGNVSPCGFLKGLIGSNMIGGNIRHSQIEDIWLSSEIFQKFRNLETPEKCNQCKYKLKCSGGCRTRAYYEFGCFDMNDPLCIS